jgi:membrane protein implicated in regulation of membrane protease activity
MSQQLRAIRKTAGMLAIATVVPTILLLFFQLPADIIAIVLAAGVLIYFVWIIYSVNLGQIRHDDEIKEIEQRYNDVGSNKKA